MHLNEVGEEAVHHRPRMPGPVRHPPRKQTVFIPKYLPYSWTIASAASFETPNSECFVLIDRHRFVDPRARDRGGRRIDFPPRLPLHEREASGDCP